MSLDFHVMLLFDAFAGAMLAERLALPPALSESVFDESVTLVTATCGERGVVGCSSPFPPAVCLHDASGAVSVTIVAKKASAKRQLRVQLGMLLAKRRLRLQPIV